jgi:hypothetical protein
MTSYRASWVPHTDHQSWNEGAALAVAWIEQEATDQGAGAVLVTNALRSADAVPAFESFRRRHAHTTPLAGGHRVARGTGPALAYVPDTKTLDFAAGLTHESSLCVVESMLLPLAGWARETGALDLTSALLVPAPLDPRLAKGIASLDFYGNNTWSGAIREEGRDPHPDRPPDRWRPRPRRDPRSASREGPLPGGH